MSKFDFPAQLVPAELRKKIIYKKYYRKDLLLSSHQNKILYLVSGHAHIIRYEESGDSIFPYVFSDDEFIGLKQFLCNPSPTWEVYVNSDLAEVYEIPVDIFETYIMPSPIFLSSYLKKSAQMLSYGNKAYYVYFKGGLFPYFAYILDYAFTVYPVFTLERYSNLTDILSISKASLYNFTNKFVDEKIIKKDRNTLTLLDRKKLKDYFNHFLI